MSKIFIIPIGVALMAGFFFLGYYVGKYQSKTNQAEIVVPLPEVISKNLPQKQDFTFFKTLTDRDNKTVSIELKPQQFATEPKKSEPDVEKKTPAQKERKAAAKPEKHPAVKAPEPKEQSAKKEIVITRSPDAGIRYTLQIASYQEREMAEADVKKMKQRGFAAFIVASELQGKGTWYRVRVGSLSSKASAEKLQKELRAKTGVTPFITIE